MPPATGISKVPRPRRPPVFVPPLRQCRAYRRGQGRLPVRGVCMHDAPRPLSGVQGSRPWQKGGLRVAATLIIVLAACVLMAGSVLAVRWCLRALRRRRERRTWDELVIRHRNLDRELERIWRSR